MKLIKLWTVLVLILTSFTFFSCNDDPTCSDGEQNGGEIGIDCGGPCISCDSIGLVITNPIDTSDMIIDTSDMVIDSSDIIIDPADLYSCDTLICAQINGTDFTGYISYGDTDATSLLIIGTTGIEQLSINFSGTQAVGTYDFSMAQGIYNNGTTTYTTGQASDGSITFTVFDAVAQTVSGTFEFTAIGEDSTDVVEVTNGTFMEITYE